MWSLGQDAALEALRRAVLAADLDAWRVVLHAGPRGAFARWRVKRALRQAGQRLGLEVDVGAIRTEVSLRGELDPVGARVALLQAAWLCAAGQPERVGRPSLAAVLHTEAGSSAVVARRAELGGVYWRALGARKGASRRGQILLIAGVVVVALGVFLLTRPTPPTPEPPPLSTLGHIEAERESAWVEAITDWVVALDRLSRLEAEGALSGPLREANDNLEAHRQAIIGEATGLPAAVRGAADELLSAARAAIAAGDAWDKNEKAFAEATRRFNRVLREHGLGYFFDAYAALYPGRGEVGLFVFRVAAAVRYRQTGAPGSAVVDALHLRRIDRLNLVQFLLGYTSRRMDVAVVLLDKLEHQLATRIGPSLVPNAAMPLEADGKTFDGWDAVKLKAGSRVREAFYGAFPGEQQALTELGELLAERDGLFRGWNETLSRKNIILRVPEQLEIGADYLAQFERVTSTPARRKLEELQERLEVASMRRFFLRLLARHASSVERHEVQHRLDYADEAFAPPRALLITMGLDPDDGDALRDKSVERAAAELSAYTAELARDPEWALVNLSLLAEHLYDGSGGAEGWSALLILDGLGELLGVFAPSPPGKPAAQVKRLADSLPLEGADIAPLHLALLDKPPAEISGAAARLWEGWFGKTLPVIETGPVPDRATP